jgi:hypothetical protein
MMPTKKEFTDWRHAMRRYAYGTIIKGVDDWPKDIRKPNPDVCGEYSVIDWTPKHKTCAYAYVYLPEYLRKYSAFLP